MVIDEKDLIAGILQGDRDRFCELVRVHQSRLFQLCLGYLGDPLEAEESAHVVFIKAYRALGRFRGESSFGTWLFRIGINHCKDVLKKRGRNHVESLEGWMERAGRVPTSLVERPVPEESPVVEAAREALGGLSPGESEVFLRVAETPDPDYGEIAGEMGLTREGVKGRLKRARMKVQAYLRKRGIR